jgi:hypothetical protein
MSMKKKEITPMEKLTQGYEKFIKSKEINSKGKVIFDNVIKKAAKQRSVK